MVCAVSVCTHIQTDRQTHTHTHTHTYATCVQAAQKRYTPDVLYESGVTPPPTQFGMNMVYKGSGCGGGAYSKFYSTCVIICPHTNFHGTQGKTLKFYHAQLLSYYTCMLCWPLYSLVLLETPVNNIMLIFQFCNMAFYSTTTQYIPYQRNIVVLLRCHRLGTTRGCDGTSIQA